MFPLKAFPRPYDPASSPTESGQSATSNNPLESRRQHVEELRLQAEEVRAQRELDRLEAEDREAKEQREAEARANAIAERCELEQVRLEAARVGEARKQKAREAKSQRRRRQWEIGWSDYALKVLPQDVPRSLGLEVHQAVLEALSELGPDQPAEITKRLVHAAVERALDPWRRRKEIDKIIAEASNQLPVFAKSILKPTEWEGRAMRAAADAIAQLESNAPLAKIRATTIEAGNRIRAEYEAWRAAEDHRQVCQRLVDSVFLPEGTLHDAGAARRAVKEALAKVPVGANRTELETTRDATLAPFRAAIAERQATARATSDADRYLAHVGDYIERLNTLEHGPGHLDGYSERRCLAEQIATEIRPALIERLGQGPLDQHQAHQLIEGIVDAKLDGEQ